MPNQEMHPEAGKVFRIDLGPGLQAIQDVHLHGKLVRIEDWADRMEYSELTEWQISVILQFYVNRCLPDFPELELIRPSDVDLRGLVLGTVLAPPVPGGFVERTILRKSEMASVV